MLIMWALALGLGWVESLQISVVSPLPSGRPHSKFKVKEEAPT